MKFTCLQENLAKGINTVSRAVPAKSPLPITTHILIETVPGGLKLSATNLDTTITTLVPASIEETGSITIPAKLLRDFVATLSPSTITGHLEDNVLHLSSQKTKSKFNGVSASEFPAIPTMPEEGDFIELDPNLFSYAISHVAFASANDEARPVFSGIYLNLEDGELTVAACDGFRLAEKKLKIENTKNDLKAIIPAKTLAEIAKIFAGSEEPIKFVLNSNENLALFQSGDTLVASRILSGDYPDYKRIIPQETTISAEFAAEELLEAVKLTNLFSTEATSAIKMKLNPDGNIVLTSATQETGEHESDIEAQITGGELELAFNSKYLLDLLSNVKSERFKIETNGNLTPCIFVASDHEGLLNIIMPMQIT
ncbi:MAG TPA: DNA polymerase III subunit beta [Candidatus Saccharimonadales bacterium]|nr:DNA polymerase III subunit beta [Candidatus Saccharimonadales bacterium]